MPVRRIGFEWDGGRIAARLRSTPTATRLLEHLPLTGRANVWGDEVYFGVPFSVTAESDATEVVERGAVCFWLDGDAIALLFGPTPVSRGEECRLISPANVCGQLEGDLERLRGVAPGAPIRVVDLGEAASG